jgi:hypothetical protein
LAVDDPKPIKPAREPASVAAPTSAARVATGRRLPNGVVIGTMKGMISLPEDWDAPMTGEELRAWEGR